MKIEFVVKIWLFILLFSMIGKVTSAHETITMNDGWRFRYGTDSVAVPVHLPHSWNGDAYHSRDYKRGSGEYTKQIRVPSNFNGKRLYLKFDGAATKSEVRIDGKSVGSHIGAYSSHIIDVTPYLTPGATHELNVRVDNADRNIPPHSADFTFMGGLYRDSWLIAAAPVHFAIQSKASHKVTTRVGKDGVGSADIRGTIVNATGKKCRAEIRASLYAPDGTYLTSRVKKVTLNNGLEPYSLSFNNICGVDLWTPETPSLYRLVLDLSVDGSEVDSLRENIGFRTFSFDDQGRFTLNGKPYKLRGQCRHQDQSPMGIALTDEQHRRDIGMIKEMGANFIRISHYPQDDAVLEMCDRLGLIAWEEIPVIDYVPESGKFAENCEIMLREMIRDHYNHPSIAMWGYMNEILLRMPGENKDLTKQRTLALAKRLEQVVAEEDSTRMTTMAFHGSDVYHGAGLSDITDVKGWNLYQGWYGGRFDGFEEFLSRQHREHPDHRLIVSEYGAGSDLRIHSLNPEPFDFSMEYQQKYLEHYLPVIEDSSFVAGASHWNFIDFSSANRAESMPHINNKGIVTNDRLKKDVSYYYKSLWHDVSSDTVAHIAVRDWPERTDIPNRNGHVEHPVKVYTNLPAVVLKINGMALGRKEVDNCHAIFNVPLTPGHNLIEIASDESPEKILDAATVTLHTIGRTGSSIDLTTEELAVNVGSGCYFRSDDSGLSWIPDREYTPGGLYGHIGGKRSVSQDEISLTADGPLFQRCVTGLEEYRLDVAPGDYEVELLFAELASPSAQSAYMLGHNAGSDGNKWTSMDILINGRKVEEAFSPGSTAGVKTMVRRKYTAHVDGERGISISFAPSTDGVTTSLSAIKIRKI